MNYNDIKNLNISKRGKKELLNALNKGGVTIVDSVDKLDADAPAGSMAVVVTEGEDIDAEVYLKKKTWEVFSPGGEGGSGVTIVDSVDKLDKNAPAGSLAVVASGGTIEKHYLSECYQATMDDFDPETGEYNYEVLSKINNLDIVAPISVPSFENPIMIELSSPLSSGSNSIHFFIDWFDNKFTVGAEGIIDGKFMEFLTFIIQEEDKFIANTDNINILKDILKTKEWYYGIATRFPVDDTPIPLTEEEYSIVNSIFSYSAEIPLRVDVYIKKDSWSLFPKVEIADSYESLDLNARVGSLGVVVTPSTLKTCYIEDLYQPDKEVDFVTNADEGTMTINPKSLSKFSLIKEIIFTIPKSLPDFTISFMLCTASTDIAQRKGAYLIFELSNSGLKLYLSLNPNIPLPIISINKYGEYVYDENLYLTIVDFLNSLDYYYVGFPQNEQYPYDESSFAAFNSVVNFGIIGEDESANVYIKKSKAWEKFSSNNKSESDGIPIASSKEELLAMNLPIGSIGKVISQNTKTIPLSEMEDISVNEFKQDDTKILSGYLYPRVVGIEFNVTPILGMTMAQLQEYLGGETVFTLVDRNLKSNAAACKDGTQIVARHGEGMGAFVFVTLANEVITDKDEVQLALFNKFLNDNNYIYGGDLNTNLLTAENKEKLSNIISFVVDETVISEYIMTENGLISSFLFQKAESLNSKLATKEDVPFIYISESDTDTVITTAGYNSILIGKYTQETSVEIQWGIPSDSVIGNNICAKTMVLLQNVNSVIFDIRIGAYDEAPPILWKDGIAPTFTPTSTYKLMLEYIKEGDSGTQFLFGRFEEYKSENTAAE